MRLGRLFKTLLFLAVIAAIIIVPIWHNREMKELREELEAKQAQELLMSDRMQEIQTQLGSMQKENDSLLEKIEEMLTEEVPVLDSAVLEEKVLEIGELATVEYRYTNVGTLDSVKTLSFVDLQIPFTKKSAVVSIDGSLKAGIDVTKVSIGVNEITKTISIKMPEAKVLSNELFEDTMAVYLEENSLFSKITLDDSSSIRTEIKDKAQQKAVESGILDQAKEKAETVISAFIESVPGVKGVYSLNFR